WNLAKRNRGMEHTYLITAATGAASISMDRGRKFCRDLTRRSAGKEKTALPSASERDKAVLGKLRSLRQELFDHLAFAEQLDGSARRRHELLVRVDAQAMENRSGEIVRRARIGCRGHALHIRGAMH